MRELLFLAIIFSCLSCTDKRNTFIGLYIENADWDFGDVKSNDCLEHTFVMENTSKEICIINSIVASCGCTNYSLEKDTLLPNEKSNLSVTLKTPSTTGDIVRDIAVYTSLREEPYIITLNAYIPLSKQLVKKIYCTKLSDNIFAKANMLYMGNLFKNKQITRQVELVNVSDHTIDISYKIEPNYQWVEIIGMEKLDPWRPELLTIMCNGEKMKDDDWGEKEFQIKVGNGIIKCILNIVPIESKKLSKIDRPAIYIPHKEYHVLKNGNEDKIEIRNVGNSNLKVLKARTNGYYDVVINDSIIPGRKSGFFYIKSKNNLIANDTLEILTNDMANPLVKIYLIK